MRVVREQQAANGPPDWTGLIMLLLVYNYVKTLD